MSTRMVVARNRNDAIDRFDDINGDVISVVDLEQGERDVPMPSDFSSDDDTLLEVYDHVEGGATPVPEARQAALAELARDIRSIEKITTGLLANILSLHPPLVVYRAIFWRKHGWRSISAMFPLPWVMSFGGNMFCRDCRRMGGMSPEMVEFYDILERYNLFFCVLYSIPAIIVPGLLVGLF